MSDPQFLSGIKVVYGDDKSQEPQNSITEFNQGSNNINDGFGGRFVWLVREDGPVPDLAVTNFNIVIQKEPDPSRRNLAEGAGGDYRYLILENAMSQPDKVDKVYLLRRDGTVGDSPSSGGWKYSSDINEGRGPPALNLIWTTSAAVPKPPFIVGISIRTTSNDSQRERAS